MAGKEGAFSNVSDETEENDEGEEVTAAEVLERLEEVSSHGTTVRGTEM